MKRTFLLASALSILVSGPFAEAAGEKIAADQMQPIVEPTIGAQVIGGESQQKLAQTLTVGLNGRLLGLLLPIACNSGVLVIEIRELDGDEPGDTVIGRREVPANRIPQPGQVFHFFSIGWPLPFAAGDRVAVVLQNPTGSCAIFSGPEGDSYAGGQGFFEALPNPPVWVPFFGTGTSLDLPFMALMRLD